MAKAPRGWALALIPWAALGVFEAYLALGYAGIPDWSLLLGEVALAVAIGAALAWGLPSLPGAASTLAPLVPVFSALATQMPRSLGALPYLLGLAVVLGLPVLPLMRGRGLRWWLSAVLVFPAVLFAHGVHVLGAEVGLAGSARKHMLHDLTWPSRLPELPPPADAGPPILLISVDTLRADRAKDMQSYQRLAARGASWESAMSTSSWTLPALASLQTGSMPGEHGAGCLHDSHCQGLHPHVRTLAMDLADRGYTNVAVLANPWAGQRSGIERGFHGYVDLGNDPPRRLVLLGPTLGPHEHQDAELVVSIGIQWLERIRERPSFYLWIHLVDPHLPYTHSDDPELRAMSARSLRNSELLTTRRRNEVVAAYESEVGVVDSQLERLLDAVEESGLLDRAIVVLTSDHGEELFDHGSYEHGHSHHAEVIEVPLVLVAPGMPPGQRAGVASLLDVPTTIRHAVGIPTPGVDLRRATLPDRIVTAQGNLVLWQACSARSGQRRVLIDDCSGSPRIRRYDRIADPGEHHALPGDASDPVQRAASAVEAPSAGVALDTNLEALRALGYVE